MSPDRVFTPGHEHGSEKGSHGWRLGLGTWLTILILGTLLPMSLLSGVATRRAAESTRELALARLDDLARALASAVDNQLRAQVAALQTLSLSRPLEGMPGQWDVPALDLVTRRVAVQLGAAVAIIRPDGSQIINTLLPGDAPLQKTALGAMVDEAVARRFAVVSDLARSTLTGRLGFGVGVPVEREGQIVAVLAVLSNTSILHELLKRQNLPEGIFASLVDRQALVIARSDGLHTDYAGRRIVAENAVKLQSGLSGRYEGYALEGVWRHFAFTKLGMADGWALVVGQKAEDLNAEGERSSVNFAWAVIATLGLSGALALLITRIIVGPIAALDRYAEKLGTSAHSGTHGFEQSYVTQVARLQSNVLHAEQRLRANDLRFREFLTLLDRAIFMARRFDGRIFYWSQGAEAFYGFSRDEANGQVSHHLLKTVFSVPLLAIEESLETRSEWRGELVHTTKSGHRVDVVAQMSMTIRDSGEMHVLEILHDVTDLHRTQRELEMALETGDIGTFFIDLADDAVMLDERSRKLLGSSDAVLSRSAFVALIPASQRAAFHAALSRCIGLRGDGLLDFEMVVDHGQDETTIISLRGQAELSGGTPVTIAGVMMDVSRLRRHVPGEVGRLRKSGRQG